MIELFGAEKACVLPLFDRPYCQIVRSCCQGLVASRVFADDARAPTAAVLSLSRMGIGFAAGDARQAAGLLDCLRGWHAWYEITNPPPSWHPALAAWSRDSFATVRYGFSVGASGFDLDKLRALASPPPGTRLRRYDEALLRQALSSAWSEDQLGAFETPEAFCKEGLGVALVSEDGALLAGCTSFCRHADGYEIQIDTHPDARGKGYAACVGAAFVLETLSRDLTPYWDAANIASLRLSQKLGFIFREAYACWMLVSDKATAEEAAKRAIAN